MNHEAHEGSRRKMNLKIENTITGEHKQTINQKNQASGKWFYSFLCILRDLRGYFNLKIVICIYLRPNFGDVLWIGKIKQY